ncbi:hypothetical protein [Dongia deserti]|uniref:hypothetical protein n=1 Tax=Dongia deserti TaxID=2268030 RepID=UPI000E64BF0B|nr:hypothetical protein [Dongia deserti]
MALTREFKRAVVERVQPNLNWRGHTGLPDADSVTEITEMLSLTAESCGGEYDGWKTQVLS